MRIFDGIETVGTGLWLAAHETLVVCDVHLGYESELVRKGVLVPSVQRGQVEQEVKFMLSRVRPKRIVINGDLKHEFGAINRQEWRDVTALLKFLRAQCEELVVLEGNHDPLLDPIARKVNISLGRELRLGEILITHGDRIPKKLAPVVIIGHEHPAVSIREGAKAEKFKCFLKGKFKRSVLIVQPSLQPLVEGSDVLAGGLLSPLITDIDSFEVFVVDSVRKDALFFGKIKYLRGV